MTLKELDIGDGHFIRYFGWWPDDLPANRANYNVADGEPMPRVEKAGILIRHSKPNGDACEGAVNFDLPDLPQGFRPRWTVESLEPLTLSPSILCKAENCGDHGFIRDGRWVRA